MYFAEFGVSNGLQILCLAAISSEKLIAAMIVAGFLGIPFAGIALYFRPRYKKAKKSTNSCWILRLRPLDL